MTRIVSLLGRIESDVEVDNASASPNSTRWVFDIEQDPGSVAFDLTRNGKRVRAAILSFALAPLEPEFYAAKVYFSKTNGSGLELTCERKTKYRVTIDTVASMVH